MCKEYPFCQNRFFHPCPKAIELSKTDGYPPNAVIRCWGCHEPFPVVGDISKESAEWKRWEEHVKHPCSYDVVVEETKLDVITKICWRTPKRKLLRCRLI